MKIGLSLNLQQKLELKLQPRQILCNELLMLPLLDLEATLQNELEENIFLESDQGGQVTSLLPEPEPAVKMTPPGGDEDPQNAHEDRVTDPEQLSSLLEYLKDSRSSVAPSGGDIPEAFDVEARVSLPISWRQSLTEALRLERLTDDEELVAEYLIGCLDERGYITESVEEISQSYGAPVETVERAIEILQRVSPPGVGARDLQERLLLQARALSESHDVLERILSRCYKELLHGKFDLLRKRLGISEDELREALEQLRELTHESMAIEDNEPAAGVIPDASVTKTDEGWKVKLHDESVPRLRLSPYASNLAKKADALNPEAKDYLQRALMRAKWMMEALDQRRNTLRRIVEAVVDRQEEYLERGEDALVPLRQEDVAQTLNLHPSTVSRAVQEKYVETPRGVSPLRDFFPRGVNSHNGSQQARNTVQDRLAAIVDGEDPERPYSDDKLVDLLTKDNVKISRRTVCKYRQELNIPPASKRKGFRLVMRNKR